jgi:hypothetical protein
LPRDRLPSPQKACLIGNRPASAAAALTEAFLGMMSRFRESSRLSRWQVLDRNQAASFGFVREECGALTVVGWRAKLVRFTQ